MGVLDDGHEVLGKRFRVTVVNRVFTHKNQSLHGTPSALSFVFYFSIGFGNFPTVRTGDLQIAKLISSKLQLHWIAKLISIVCVYTNVSMITQN